METMEENMRRIKIIVLICAMLFSLVACKKEEKITFKTTDVETSDSEEESSDQEDNIFVQVSGAVNSEGVYQLPRGSRVFEAISMAGGLREDAEVSGINQAQLLEDEAYIYVPTIDEQLEKDSKESGKVNINQASKETLMTLPGVGESRADSIIKYRQEHGSFQKIEDIMQVAGIKEGLFEKIKDLITV